VILPFRLGPDWAWNIFDFAIVIAVWIGVPGTNVSFIRLLRLMRLLKLLNKVKELQIILQGLIRALQSVVYILMLLALSFFLFGTLGVTLFRRNDPFHWGGLGIAMVTLFRTATFENWTEILYLSYFGCDSQHTSIVGVCAVPSIVYVV
jgi:voltage-gated sodium channel